MSEYLLAQVLGLMLSDNREDILDESAEEASSVGKGEAPEDAKGCSRLEHSFKQVLALEGDDHGDGISQARVVPNVLFAVPHGLEDQILVRVEWSHQRIGQHQETARRRPLLLRLCSVVETVRKTHFQLASKELSDAHVGVKNREHKRVTAELYILIRANQLRQGDADVFTTFDV